MGEDVFEVGIVGGGDGGAHGDVVECVGDSGNVGRWDSAGCDRGSRVRGCVFVVDGRDGFSATREVRIKAGDRGERSGSVPVGDEFAPKEHVRCWGVGGEELKGC